MASHAISLYPNLSDGITFESLAGSRFVIFQPSPKNLLAVIELAFKATDDRFCVVKRFVKNVDAIKFPVVSDCVLITFALIELVNSCPELI